MPDNARPIGNKPQLHKPQPPNRIISITLERSSTYGNKQEAVPKVNFGTASHT